MGSTLADNLASEFLRILDEGYNPDVEEFLSRIPEEHREECRERIKEIALLNGKEINFGAAGDEKPEPEATASEQLAQEIAQADPDAEAPVEQLSEEEALRKLDEQLRAAGAEEIHFSTGDEPKLKSVADELEEYSEKTGGLGAIVAGMEEPPPVEVKSVSDEFGGTDDDVEVPSVSVRSASDELGGDTEVETSAEPPAPKLRRTADELDAEPSEAVAEDAEPVAEAHDEGPVEEASEEAAAEESAVEEVAEAADDEPPVEEAKPKKLTPEEAKAMFSAASAKPEPVEERAEPEAQDEAELHEEPAVEEPMDEEDILAGESAIHGVDDLVDDDLADEGVVEEGVDEFEEEEAAPPAARDEPRYSFPRPSTKAKKPRKKKKTVEPVEPEELPDDLKPELLRHMRDVDTWGRRGQIAEDECDRLGVIYRRLLDYEPPDSLSSSLVHIVFCMTATAAAAGSALLVWFGSSELPAAAQWGLPVLVCAVLLGAGLWARVLRKDKLGASVLLTAGVLATLPAVLAVATAFKLFATPAPGVVQFFTDGPATNGQLLLAMGTGLAVCLGSFALVGRTVFAWMAALLATGTYVSFWMTRDLLAMELPQAALRLLPLVLLAIPALLCEGAGKVRWARPFHFIALVALVASVEAMAVGGAIFGIIGLDSLVGPQRAPHLGFALSGVLLLAAIFPMRKARSLDLHAAAWLLRIVVAVQLVATLYANAAHNRAWRDVAACMMISLGLVILGRWRNRQTFFTAGLTGLVLAAFLVMQIGLVSPVGFTVALAVGGLVATLGTYFYLRRSRPIAEDGV